MNGSILIIDLVIDPIISVIVESVEMRTLPVGLAFFSGEAGVQWDMIMTGASIATVPVLIIFIIFQKHIIKGVALAGLKG